MKNRRRNTIPPILDHPGTSRFFGYILRQLTTHGHSRPRLPAVAGNPTLGYTVFGNASLLLAGTGFNRYGSDTTHYGHDYDFMIEQLRHPVPIHLIIHYYIASSGSWRLHTGESPHESLHSCKDPSSPHRAGIRPGCRYPPPIPSLKVYTDFSRGDWNYRFQLSRSCA
jgi:hypothetical protein